jgi:hypothetical protein
LWSIVSANRTHSQLPLPPSPGSGSEWLSEWGREGSDTWSNEEKGVVGLVLVLKALKIQDSFFNSSKISHLQYKSNYLNHEMDPGFANVK